MNEKIKNFADSISPLIFLDFLFESRKNLTRLIIYFVISLGLIITVFFMQLSYSDSSRAGVINAFFIIICTSSALIGGTYS
ncbi:MAG TPA: hypothetical protein PKW98_20655, partial [Candidatus Wallbacteria bacterium]|nr:hypothetical protein [Candidatus Wallbacteria bacterium]